MTLVCLLPIYGQVNKSNLTGVVHDASGSAIADVKIKLVNVATGIGREELSDTSGLYRFTLLDFGMYRLEANLAGFKTLIRDGIQLQTGETTTVDLTLQVGEQADSVTVSAESPLLRTETGALGTSVNSQVINELPLIGRNPYVFLTLSAGIQYTGSPAALNPWDSFGPSDFSSSGSRSRSEFLLDGIPNMRIDVVSFSPSPDAVQEMRVQTNAFDAEYGHSGAAFVNVSTKSGTNLIHGSLYWYLQNSALNANDFFNNRSGKLKSPFKQNTYGGAIGGPVRIPKLYDGRDRTHYFFDFEGTQIRSASVVRAIVPTLLERTGDFSQTRDGQGRAIAIFDPLTTRAAGTGFVRDAFPGNTIPANRLDPIALNVEKFYPLPNLARTSTNQQNFENSQINNRRWASLLSRVDHQLSPNQILFFRFGWNHRYDPSSPYYGDCCRAAGNPTTGQDEFFRANITAAVGHTWVKSPRTVLDFRLGFTRYAEGNIMYGEGFDVTKLGFPASFARSAPFPTFPRFEMNGDLDNVGAGRTTARTFINQYNPLVNVHTNFGRHQLKYGFRYQVAQSHSFNPARGSGYYFFDRSFTQGPDPTRTSVGAGYDLASFLLGTPSRGYTDFNVAPALENKYSSGYVQDDWKMSDRLTLNLGLRFEHESPTTDRFDRGVSGFDFGVTSPLQDKARSNYVANPIPELSQLNVRGGLGFLNVGGTPRGHLSMPAVLFGPRFGYAYRVNNRMVWRGGYGVFYVPNNLNNFRQVGFSLATQMISSLDNNLTPFNTLSNAFPNGLVQPPGAANGLLTAAGQSITTNAAPIGSLPDFRLGLSQQFAMGFQFVLPAQISLETSYAGNVSQHLSIDNRNVNQYPDQYLALQNRLNAKVPNPFFGVITDTTSALSQPTTTVAQLLKPYPQFLGITQSALPLGRSHYDSLQVQMTKRTSKGLYFGAVYSFSKYMEAISYLNANDVKPERAISIADRPQRVTLHGIYELPFGPGKPFLTNSKGLVRHLVEGWRAMWVATYQVSAPLQFTNAQRLRKSDANPHTVDKWFDTAQFVPLPPFTLNTLSSSVVDLRAPGIRKWDLTAMKRISIREGVEMRLQGEFYNAFNTTMFGSPNTTVTSASFGRITSLLINPRQIQVSARVTF